MDDAQNIDRVEKRLRDRIRQSWSNAEREEIRERGELEADFYRIWYKLCKLDSMRRWVKNYGKLTRSYRRILKEYDKSVI